MIRFAPSSFAARAGLLIALAASLTGAPAASSVAGAASGTRLSTIMFPNGGREVLRTPADLRVSLYASGLSTPRFMALGPRGDVFVGSTGGFTAGAGPVSVLLNRAGGKQATRVVTLLSGLTIPHSVAYRNGLLYVAEEGRVTSYRYDPAGVSVSGQRVIIPDLPTGGKHVTRTVSAGPDGMLYVSVGSSCNECVDYATRALIMRYRADGTGGQVYARGLRNAVGLAWQPGTNRLWATENGRDLLGENVPPDEIDLITQGANYGWPYCWDDGQKDPAVYSAPGYCAQTTNPVLDLPAHSAPLGAAFYAAHLLPARYWGGLFVAYHGSEYRSQPTGYKVVYIPINGTHASAPQDVVTGWLPAGATSGNAAWGRPVGLQVAADGSLLISDDLAGAVYRLAPVGR